MDPHLWFPVPWLLVGGLSHLPLWKILAQVSWDDDIPIIYGKSIQIPWFQSPPIRLPLQSCKGPYIATQWHPPMTSGWRQQSSGHIWSQGRSENDAFPMPKTLVNIWLITGSYPFWFWGSKSNFGVGDPIHFGFGAPVTNFIVSPSPQVPNSPMLFQPSPGSMFGVS